MEISSCVKSDFTFETTTYQIRVILKWMHSYQNMIAEAQIRAFRVSLLRRIRLFTVIGSRRDNILFSHEVITPIYGFSSLPVLLLPLTIYYYIVTIRRLI